MQTTMDKYAIAPIIAILMLYYADKFIKKKVIQNYEILQTSLSCPFT